MITIDREQMIQKFESVKHRKKVGNFKTDRNEQLFLVKDEGEDEYVSRNTPFIKRQLYDIESNQTYYTVYFKTKDKYTTIDVKASTLTNKRDLLTLADEGLAVNDINARNLIKFIDMYIREHNLSEEEMTTRIGHVANRFIHPEDTTINIVQSGGYQALIRSFKTKGTLDEYSKHVFDKVRNEYTALFFVLCSLASVLLKNYDIDPFIVDLSGPTSKGKTTVLRLCTTVWGTKDLMSEWNITKVALERKAAFLNSFPLILDDTRKASPFLLKDIVYQFSGGKTKARGNIKSIDEELTYNNILISTGEVAITEFNKDQAGASARVIVIEDVPFGFKDFEPLYEAMNSYYGTLGKAFLEEYQSDSKYYDNLFKTYEKQYFNEAKGNEVLSRLGRSYAVIHLAGTILNSIPGFEFELDQVMLQNYQAVASGENSTYDKPRELLVRLLEELDSKLINIKHDDDEDDERAHTLAISKWDELCIPVAVVNDFLGVEAKQMRKLWIERGFTESNNGADYFNVRYKKSRPRCVKIPYKIYSKFGFNFRKE